MSNLLNQIDARTKLAGSNKLEILLFKLEPDQPGRPAEVFGINVFKVQEVIRTPEITAIPEPPPYVVGMASLRGEIVSIVDLISFCGKNHDGNPPIMLITEFSKNIQGFLVDSVETIIRVDWNDVHPPPAMLAGTGKITAVTQLPDGRLVSILDVEQVMHTISGTKEVKAGDYVEMRAEIPSHLKIFCADDSAFARAQLKSVLDAIGVHAEFAANGREALERLERMADAAKARGEMLANTLPIIITDLEMPEMDGFLLTKKIKTDGRFAGIKVLVHSSMSNSSNLEKSRVMGADGFLSKFSPDDIANELRAALSVSVEKAAA